MFRAAAKASSAFTRLAATTSTARHTLLTPAILPNAAAVSYLRNIAVPLFLESVLFFPAISNQSRGYARSPPSKNYASGDGDDSDDFVSEDDNLSEFDEDGLVDDEFTDGDEDEDADEDEDESESK